MEKQDEKTMKVSNNTAAFIEAKRISETAFYEAVHNALIERYEFEEAPSVKEFEALFLEFEMFIDKEILSSVFDTYETTKGEQI